MYHVKTEYNLGVGLQCRLESQGNMKLQIQFCHLLHKEEEENGLTHQGNVQHIKGKGSF